MAKKPEQICPHEASVGYRRELKKQVKRARRRAERRDVENAGGQVREFLRGYSI